MGSTRCNERSFRYLPICSLEIYDTYEVEVKNTFGFEQSSVILSCEVSPPSAASYVQIVGWLEKVNKQLTQLDLSELIDDE